MRNVTSSQEEAFRLGACGQRNGQTEATTLQMAGGTAGAYDDVVTTDRYSHSELAPEPGSASTSYGKSPVKNSLRGGEPHPAANCATSIGANCERS